MAEGLTTNNGVVQCEGSGVLFKSVLSGTGTRAVYADEAGLLTNSSSDNRLKENIEALPYGINDVVQMNPVRFEYKDKKANGNKKYVGFIAQEMQQIIPEVIGVNNNGMLSLDYPSLTSVLCKAIQEQQTTIEDMQIRIQALEEFIMSRR